MDQNAGQFGRQRRAFGLLFRLGWCFINGELCQFRFNGGKIAVDQLIQQVALKRIQLFAALCELMAL